MTSSNWFEYHNDFRSFLYLTVQNEQNVEAYAKMLDALEDCRNFHGRCFIVGMGGSAANAQHLANDLRKMCKIDAISLSDNIAELTARANDDGWATIYSNSLKASNVGPNDVLFVLSVSGGSKAKGASLPLIHAMTTAEDADAVVMGIVGMSDSYAAENFLQTMVVTAPVEKYQTQFAEAMQAVVWHGLISNPRLMENAAKW